jgi:uncharacterized protein YoxC
VTVQVEKLFEKAKEFGPDVLNRDEKLDVILQALIDISEQVDALNESQGEILEKLGNLNLDTGGFAIERYDN